MPQTPGQEEVGDEVDAVSEAELLAVEDYELQYDSMTTVDELPVLSDKLTDDQVEAFTNLSNFLKQVFSSADLPRMPFAALQISPLFAKQMLGDKMWHGFYGPTRVVLMDDVVPRCMVGAIEVALKRTGTTHSEIVKNFFKNADKDKEDVATIKQWRQKAKLSAEKARTEKNRKQTLVKK